jgi:hypothetical protein
MSSRFHTRAVMGWFWRLGQLKIEPNIRFPFRCNEGGRGVRRAYAFMPHSNKTFQRIAGRPSHGERLLLRSEIVAAPRCIRACKVRGDTRHLYRDKISACDWQRAGLENNSCLAMNAPRRNKRCMSKSPNGTRPVEQRVSRGRAPIHDRKHAI